MIHLEIAIAFIILVGLILRRTAVPWRADMINRITLAKLNRIEAAVRGVSIEEIERQFAQELRDISAMEHGRPRGADRYWMETPLNKS